jgi:hypothetical protein
MSVVLEDMNRMARSIGESSMEDFKERDGSSNVNVSGSPIGKVTLSIILASWRSHKTNDVIVKSSFYCNMSPFPSPLVDEDNGSSSNGSIYVNDQDTDSYSATTVSGNGRIKASEASNSNLRDKLIKNEERAVRKSRIAVAIILLICAASVSTAVYLFAIRGEQTHFKNEYNIHANTIISLVQWDIQYNFALMQQASATMTSSIMMVNATLPFWTHPTAGKSDGSSCFSALYHSPSTKHSTHTI